MVHFLKLAGVRTIRRPGLEPVLGDAMARFCAVPGCPNLTTGYRCPTHSRRPNDRGRAARQPWRSYHRNWPAIRARVLRETPTCVRCGNRADEVDHIVPLRAGGDHRRSNLQALCKSCHSRKTAGEVGLGGAHD